jgi:signal transduction histidine kinase
MDTDLEILKNLAGCVKFAAMRTSNNQLVFVNEHALELFGYASGEEMRMMSRRMLFADGEAYYDLRAKQKAYGLITNERVLFIRKDKTNFWGLLTSKPHYVDGTLCIDETIVDISAQVTMEHKLREKDLLLEKVAGELDRFIYSASHDLRSPISSMKGLLSLVRMNPKAVGSEHFVDMMEESLDRLDVFISKLVEFSRNSNEPVVIRPVNLNCVIKSILEEQQRHTNWPKVNVECSLPDSFVVRSDFKKIYTVLLHVIKNALDYSDITKCSLLLSIKGQIQRDVVTIEIVDNGIGIDKKFMPMVFQMFFRATMLSKGSGLGLYLAREAINRLGGNIMIASELNHGTLVTIQFPADVTSRVDENRKTA